LGKTTATIQKWGIEFLALGGNGDEGGFIPILKVKKSFQALNGHLLIRTIN
jgi:hypothetical protein